MTASSGATRTAGNTALAAMAESFQPVDLNACPVLHTGYPTGGCLAQLRTDLNVIQGNHLAVDGTFGSIYSQTYNAVIAFQKAQGLTQDGMVGPATKAALTTALSSSSATPETPVSHNYPASFNPQAAAAWAVANALVPIPVPKNWKQLLFTGDEEPCTTFVSWALAKGGMPEEPDWFPYWDSPSTQHPQFLYMSSNSAVPAWYAANNFVARFTDLYVIHWQ